MGEVNNGSRKSADFQMKHQSAMNVKAMSRCHVRRHRCDGSAFRARHYGLMEEDEGTSDDQKTRTECVLNLKIDVTVTGFKSSAYTAMQDKSLFICRA